MNQAGKTAVYLFSYDGITTWYCGVGTATRHFIQSMPQVIQYLQKAGFEEVNFYAVTPFYDSACSRFRPEVLKQSQYICQSLHGDVLYQLNGTAGDETYVDFDQWQATSMGAANILINYFHKYTTNIVFVNDTTYCGVSSFLFRQLSKFQGNRPIIVWVPHSTGLIHQLQKDETRYNWEKQPIDDANRHKECFVAYINDFMKNHLLAHYGASENKLVALTNGLPLFEKLTSPEPLEVIQKYALPLGQNMVLAAGRTSRYKGFQYLVKAFAESQKDHDAQLILLLSCLGTYEAENNYQEVRQLFSDLKIRGKIINQFVPQAELRAIFRLPNARAVVVPSLAEPFGLIPLEVRHWCDDVGPVLICSNVDGLQELIHHNEDGFLVDVQNTGQFGEAIARAVNLTFEERKRFWLKGKVKLQQRYDYPQNIANAIFKVVGDPLGREFSQGQNSVTSSQKLVLS
ncbi:MAG: glycosyltransferase family 4 protein [Synechococcales bacterium]|nr:glycosyltransferase family 4 protein [Synechococcales bacterium]